MIDKSIIYNIMYHRPKNPHKEESSINDMNTKILLITLVWLVAIICNCLMRKIQLELLKLYLIYTAIICVVITIIIL